MAHENKTPNAVAITELIFETFSFHGRLIALGDQMVREFGLTSARWQVLGSIALGETPATIPNIARNLGLSRQAVQRVANDLLRDDFIIYAENPHHKRAKLVLLTEKGTRIYELTDQKYFDWANSIAKDFHPSELKQTQEVMKTLESFCTTYLDKTMKDTEK